MNTKPENKMHIGKDHLATCGRVSPDPLPWWVRLRHKLFPEAHPVLPDKLNFPATDCIHGTIGFEITWSCRIRTLITGRVEIQTRTICEHAVGRTKLVSSCHTLAPRWMYDKDDRRRL
jgi:hypothetical protein